MRRKSQPNPFATSHVNHFSLVRAKDLSARRYRRATRKKESARKKHGARPWKTSAEYQQHLDQVRDDSRYVKNGGTDRAIRERLF